MSSPPLHLTIPPPSSLTSPLYWLALLHHTGDPVERIFSLYKEKMQLRRLWDDRKDLLRASLPLTSDGHPRLLQHQIIWTASILKAFAQWGSFDLNDAGFHSLHCQSVWVIQDPKASIFLLCAPSCSLDFVRRRLSAQFVLQVRGEGARGQMAALAIQRTDNFLHTFLQVCCIIIFFGAMHADLLAAFGLVKATTPQFVRNEWICFTCWMCMKISKLVRVVKYFSNIAITEREKKYQDKGNYNKQW